MSEPMSDEPGAEALFKRSDLVRLEGKVRRAMTSFVSVELPEGWAPASFALPTGTVSDGDALGVAGIEDASLANAKRKGLRVEAVRVGPEGSARYLIVHHADPTDGSGPPAGGTPPKNDMDWSDV
jgi:hypothetical protein